MKLSKQRKEGIKLTSTMADKDFIQNYKLLTKNVGHKTNPAGITCMDLNPHNENLVK
jgi:hypothetical protein